MKGLKYDTGKIEWNLLPLESLRETVKVLMMGATKYAPNNWKYVFPKKRYFDALIRHMDAWQRGEKEDQESGLNPLAHVICDAMFLLWHDMHPQKRIYIAGPMTGIEDYNFPAFMAAEKKLKAAGYDVVNPARLSHVVWDTVGKKSATREDYYRVDFRELTQCDTVYFLNGWEKSEGTTLEHLIAKSMGLTLLYQADEANTAS